MCRMWWPLTLTYIFKVIRQWLWKSWLISSRSFGLDLENRVLSVACTVLGGFFPYLVQMITSMRRCVACDDLWPWPISSRSFGLDLENCVLSVASTVLGGFFPYLVQMIASMRRCVACDDLWPWLISSRSFDSDFENRVRSVTCSVLDRLFFWLGIQYDSIVWVIMRRRGVSSERRRSSRSSSRSSVNFQGHTEQKIANFHLNWVFLDCNSSLISPMAMKWCTKLEAAPKTSHIVFQGHPKNFKATWDKISPFFTRIGHFHIVTHYTQVWIHWWQWNNAQSIDEVPY